MKKIPLWKCSVLALALVAAASRPAAAQQAASQGLSAASEAALQTRKSELTRAARIYGYDVAEGNWTVEQAFCAAMPDTILLRYHLEFSGGAESLFIAAVPRASGRIRIVPVLYRGATPFVPAPTNPRNVALFNQLAPQPFGKGNSVELSACYAALTGARVNPDTGSAPKVGIAGAPAPTVHLEPQGKLLGVTLATRESASAYKVWDLSLNQAGRVRSVTTQDQPVYTAKSAAPRSSAESEAQVNPLPVASQVTPPVAGPGWKMIPRPPDPPSKMIPPAAQPSVIHLPEP
ncbi:MAG: hypothetical protein WBD10_00290 [Acidobacteriaceae bacterium]